MRYYKNTIQYKYGGHLYSVNGQDIGLITAVYMVEVNNQTYYLITSFGQAMSIYFGEGVQVWSIQNGRLNKNSKLFKTSSGFKNAINYFYYWDEDPLAGHLRYDKKSRIFSIPITTKDEKLTGKFMRYKFTGRYFEKVKN